MIFVLENNTLDSLALYDLPCISHQFYNFCFSGTCANIREFHFWPFDDEDAVTVDKFVFPGEGVNVPNLYSFQIDTRESTMDKKLHNAIGVAIL